MKQHFKRYSAPSAPRGRAQVVILHGLFGMLDNWKTFAGHLSQDYTVYTPDLRNHGRSPHDPVFNYSVMAEDVAQFVQEHALAPVALIGHSMGGKVAMQTAFDYPELVEQLMVVDMAPRAYPPGHDHIVDALLSVSHGQIQSRAEVQSALMKKLKDKGVVLFLMKNIARRKDGSLYWRLNLPVLAAEYGNVIAAVTSHVPFEANTVFVRGGRSNYITDNDWTEIVHLFPNAQLHTIDAASHWVHADAMEELLTLTREMLASGQSSSTSN